MNKLGLFMGEPYVIACPQCGHKIVTHVMFGSGAVSCPKCSPGEVLHFDYIKEEDIRENQKENLELIKKYYEEYGKSFQYVGD